MNPGDIKILAKSNKGLDTLMENMNIYSQDVGIEKCAMLMMKKLKKKRREAREEMQLPNQKSIREHGGIKKMQLAPSIGSELHQQTVLKEKEKQRLSQKNMKTTRDKTL